MNTIHKLREHVSVRVPATRFGEYDTFKYVAKCSCGHVSESTLSPNHANRLWAAHKASATSAAEVRTARLYGFAR